jgi:hypothetical protein
MAGNVFHRGGEDGPGFDYAMQEGASERCISCVEQQSGLTTPQVLRNTIWVNIFDLVDAKRTGTPVKKHASAEALRKYTKKTKKIFPRKAAKENRFLKVLLVELF